MTTRRAIALLLVLSTLAVSVTACGLAAAAASHARRARETSVHEIRCDSLLHAADAPIRDWLARHAGRVVLPADAESPRLTILDDTFELDGVTASLSIIAFDQCAMIPLDHAHADTSIDPRLLRGLDSLALLASQHTPIFPSPQPKAPPALGERVATHNPSQPGRQPVLNINTVPLGRLAELLDGDASESLRQLAAARNARRISTPGSPALPLAGDIQPRPVLTSMSTAWSFRIDCRSGSVRRAWWCVFVDKGSTWERVQRLAIDR